MEERLRYLFRQYLNNYSTPNELEEFFDCIRNAEHDETLRKCIRKVYGELNDSSPSSTSSHVDEKGRLFVSEPEWMPPVLANEQIPQKKVKRFASLGIGILVILIAGTIWLTRQKSHDHSAPVSSLTKKSTNRSESKYLLLEDGTEVWLNAASSLSFPDHFEPRKREVILTGEAFFDVKHADKVPFIIHTRNVSTTVLGTAFNIKAYPGEKNITVSVSRGKVRVSREDGWAATLTKGQLLKVEPEKKQATEKSIATVDVAAWHQGNIVYDDERFEDIIGDIQRVYNVNIEIENPSLYGLKISTSFKKEIGIDQALQVLCKLTDTELNASNGNYMIR